MSLCVALESLKLTDSHASAARPQHKQEPSSTTIADLPKEVLSLIIGCYKRDVTGQMQVERIHQLRLSCKLFDATVLHATTKLSFHGTSQDALNTPCPPIAILAKCPSVSVFCQDDMPIASGV